MRNVLTCLLFLSLASAGSSQIAAPALTITPLKENFFIYTTYSLYAGKPYPSNSMYILTPQGAVLIDTPWDELQMLPLLDSIWQRHRQKVVACIVTHHHDDRTAGLDVLKQLNIPTYSSLQTRTISLAKSEKTAAYIFTGDTTFAFGNLILQTCYPGEGHSKDNIVVWFPADKVLYGGCLVKSTDVSGLGNLSDANLTAWPQSIALLMRKYPDAKYIIPGHEGWKSKKALKHTLGLLSRQTKKQH